MSEGSASIRPAWHADAARRADLGWHDFFEQQLRRLERSKRESGAVVRIAAEHRGRYDIWGHPRATRARAAGRLRRGRDKAELPAVGDWVLVGRVSRGLATVIHVFERRSVFLRQAPGQVTGAQVVAANVDTVLLVCSLNREFNPRRIERYLAQLFESGADPVIVLSKADLAEDADAAERLLAEHVDVPIHQTRTDDPSSIDALSRYAGRGQTVALVGSSGVGKSTLINHLVGVELLEVAEVRAADDRGRHTTRHRQLVALPGGGLLIDTPGMREIALWDGSRGLEEAFDDVAIVAERCRFRDCSHDGEPGCAVPEAIASGELAAERFEHFLRLSAEAEEQARRRAEHGWRDADGRPRTAQRETGGGSGWRDVEKKER